MMTDAIRNFPKQFLFTPEVKGTLDPALYKRFVVVGMGGSHLAADALFRLEPTVALTIHSDYTVPFIPEAEKAHTLIILSSYSGNTEEVLTVAEIAHQAGYHVAAIAVGGKLLDWAQANQVPYVQLPDTGIQPRSALGYSLVGFYALLGLDQARQALTSLATIPAEMYQAPAQALALRLKNKVPLIYAATPNRFLAYNWKIKFNENTKIPAFYNVVPELNHNEMNGFAVVPSTRSLSENLYCIFLRDPEDFEQNQKRFEALASLYSEQGIAVEQIWLEGQTVAEKMVRNLLLADWTSVAVAESYGIDPEPVPLVEQFKQLIARAE